MIQCLLCRRQVNAVDAIGEQVQYTVGTRSQTRWICQTCCQALGLTEANLLQLIDERIWRVLRARHQQGARG